MQVQHYKFRKLIDSRMEDMSIDQILLLVEISNDIDTYEAFFKVLRK
jgi:hypothetical protein